MSNTRFGYRRYPDGSHGVWDLVSEEWATTAFPTRKEALACAYGMNLVSRRHSDARSKIDLARSLLDAAGRDWETKTSD